jgi:hypothetical protein
MISGRRGERCIETMEIEKVCTNPDQLQQKPGDQRGDEADHDGHQRNRDHLKAGGEIRELFGTFFLVHVFTEWQRAASTLQRYAVQERSEQCFQGLPTARARSFAALPSEEPKGGAATLHRAA